jgi:hypothetical protein
VERSAFYGCENLKELQLPEFIAEIGQNAFANCYSLEKLTHEGLYMIGFGAFQNCYSLKEFDFNVSNVDAFAFSSCYSLSKIIIRDVRDIKIGNDVFYACFALFEIYNLSSTLELTKGEGIAVYAKDIYTSLDTPSKIKSLNNVIYYDNGTDFIAIAPTNRDIMSIEFDSKTTEVHDCAFRNLKNLKTVSIQDNIVKIGIDAFYGSPLKTVIINSSAIANNLISAADTGDIVSCATTVYIKTGLNTADSTYLASDYTKQSTSDKTGYDMYVRNVTE